MLHYEKYIKMIFVLQLLRPEDAVHYHWFPLFSTRVGFLAYQKLTFTVFSIFSSVLCSFFASVVFSSKTSNIISVHKINNQLVT